MKAFAYNLEKILKLRTHYEEEAKIELGRAVGILSDIERKLMVLAEETVRAQASQFSSENSAVQIQQYMFYLVRLENIREQLLQDLTIAEMKVDEARELYLEASRERKVLDKLKDKRRNEYRKTVLAEDIKTLDDLSAARRIGAESGI